ncbi:Gfo/Idh/MocA family oxidoreductase [Gemmata sp. G18]|uniref:Gfo/Idh/MocA family oxidoreductase n=1 Tax=Gemmata palustris TaxID=2822762 RepID=A0ABS5BW14_9BACT|nr:Gfo/Idh/MocA family oxidoreductase [Gemmata palustris]MBP3957899.1 Gfo/Idh/MocA family oxidoreductase [Gemmata palustris]
MPRPSPSRRTFLKTSAAAGAALAAPGFLRARNANEKLNIAIIGSGGRGAANLNGVAGENIVALCDVSTAAVEKAAEKHKSARKFTDFRKVFDHAKDFDAVVVSTCEHTHAFATLLALQHGKHVYCEKPLTHNIAEARIIREAAAKTKLATQMGTQIHAEDNYRRVVELIQTGAIGPVREVHVWVSRAWGLQSAEDAKANKDIVYVTERPKDDVKPPADLDWNLWLGPVADRPFSPIYVPGPKWYRWWEFGNGTMSDLGSHWNDLPFWALKLKAPTAVEASGPKPHPEIAPASMQATYEFPARGEMPAVKMTWHQGSYRPPQWTEKKIPQWGSGVLFVGDKGMLLSEYFKHVLLPEKQFAEFVRPKPFIEKSRGHYAEWVHACKTGAPTTCNFEYAGWLTESNHLGNVAFRAGKRLEWDAAKMKATNCPEADAFIHREYRKGWKLA